MDLDDEAWGQLVYFAGGRRIKDVENIPSILFAIATQSLTPFE